MKKFLTRALPLCLALLIFVGTLAVPVFAAEADSDDVTISGTWIFTDCADVLSSLVRNVSVTFPYFVDGIRYSSFAIHQGGIYGCHSSKCVDFYLLSTDTWSASSFSVDGSVKVSSAFYDLLCQCAYYAGPTELVGNSGNGPSIFSVFSGISSWIVGSIGTIMSMFYTEATGLTFIGTLAVAALALGVCFLIFALIRRFMNFG